MSFFHAVMYQVISVFFGVLRHHSISEEGGFLTSRLSSCLFYMGQWRQMVLQEADRAWLGGVQAGSKTEDSDTGR